MIRKRVRVGGYYNQYGTYVRPHTKTIHVKGNKKSYIKKRKKYRFPEWILND